MVNKKKKDSTVNLVSELNPFSAIAEQYRKIRTNVEFSSAEEKFNSLVVTSSSSSEGKTTTAANLAVVFAQAGNKVLLVDADLRKPNVALSFKVPNVNGLSDYLVEENLVDDTFSNIINEGETLAQKKEKMESQLIETEIENLYLLPSGPTPPNPSELLRSMRMQKLVDRLTDSFDLVIFDMPPVVPVTDAQIMATYVDGTILVVRERVTEMRTILEAKKLLDTVRAKIIGVVYNGKKKGNEAYYYYGPDAGN
ncbi:CpsD/CapB family tyrosine-protein kinase [Enterococcus dongliensis]|uniref:CpsD/CapB family tyrosine-protein kinase n=1 Tax=Enterococcus dongliensis TaxID=2559925 RepID=UPI00288F6C7D|nr:CpsD/CapB family tyrosine-protein kinase [Enterococcus dongliensis]MDT2669808.1 CpsD/CapB family tyrosine-protein kinase [Enterococcus dongliensis]MDT2703909.1 CpsD/CapB family tyrosine-protein kinase [Enterococcus dongliensis]